MIVVVAAQCHRRRARFRVVAAQYKLHRAGAGVVAAGAKQIITAGDYLRILRAQAAADNNAPHRYGARHRRRREQNIVNKANAQRRRVYQRHRHRRRRRLRISFLHFVVQNESHACCRGSGGEYSDVASAVAKSRVAVLKAAVGRAGFV